MPSAIKETRSNLQADLNSAEARILAKEAYVFGFPMVDNYRIQYSYFIDSKNAEYKTMWNQIYNTARVYTPDDKTVQTPNSDTPYSFVGADLRAEPLVITLPELEKGRYYSVQFIDMYTYVFAYVGTRTTGNGTGSFLLAGPDWNGEKPAGVKDIIHCETEFAFLIYRTQLFDDADIENVKRIQSGYKVQALSTYLGKPAPTAIEKIDFPKPLGRKEQESSPEFFNILNFLLRFCPSHPTESAMRGRFAKLGILPGADFYIKSPEIRKAIEDGITNAWKVYEEVRKLTTEHKISSADVFGSRDQLKNNYPYRMAAARDGIYGNAAEEAIYPAYFVDKDGQKMDGSANNYEVKFLPGELPPVNAFWSLTMYELPASLLSANPINRYLINSTMVKNLAKDADGGITIYIQHDSPGKDKETNWLPAPKGPFFCAMRLYWPKKEALDGTWKQPPMHRVDKTSKSEDTI